MIITGETSTLWNPESKIFRLCMLIGICFLTFGSYYVYDMPAALQEALTKRLEIDPFKYSWLYSIYSWPNCGLALLGGFLVDRVFGVRGGAILFCLLVLLGQFVFALGVHTKQYWLAFAGRFIFGLGGESLSVCQSTYTAKWFTGKELALAFGIALSFARVGSSVNMLASPAFNSHWGLPITVWIGTGICCISLLFALILAVFDVKGEQHRKMTGTEPPRSEEKIQLSDVIYFPISLWLLIIICVTFYIAVFLFTQFGGTYLSDKFDLTTAKADAMLSIPSLFSAAASPFLGFAVDRVGRSLTWVVSASALLTGVHLFYNWMPGISGVDIPIAAMVSMGIAYSCCAAALWPCVALIMPTHQLGTSYGMMTSMQNLGLAVAPLGVGYMLTVTHNNFTLMEYVFAVSAALATATTVILIFVDIAKNNRKLNCSPARYRELKEQESEETTPLIINNEN